MIQSFADKDSELDWLRVHVRKFGSDLQRIANRKLLILDAAESVNDLRIPPGNRLEQLQGNRNGQCSIRINAIVHGKRGLSPDTALRLSRALGTSDRFWINLQSRYDLEVAVSLHHEELDSIKPLISA